MADVPVKRGSGRAEKEHEEAENQDGMHAARLGFADARLEGDFIEESIPARRVGGELVAAGLLPAPDIEADAPGAECDGDGGEEVDADFAPERDVPESRADGKVRGHRSGHSSSWSKMRDGFANQSRGRIKTSL